MTFPVESIPDAAAIAPHHGIYGPVVSLIVAFLVVHHYRDRDPVFVIGGTTAGLFGFLFVWEWYPAIGAALALAGYTGALLAALRPRSDWWPYYPAGRHAVVVTGLLVGLDDVIEHSLGIPTPLDLGWTILGPVASSILAVGATLLALFLLSRYTEVDQS